MRLTIAAAILCAAASALAAQNGPQTQPQTRPQTAPAVSATSPSAGRVDWFTLLEEYGEKFSLYFTVEEDQYQLDKDGPKASPLDMISPLEFHFVLHPDFKDKKAFLEALPTWVPEAQVTVDDANPNVIHIRERKLDRIKDQALDRKVTLKLDGTVKDLLLAIKDQTHGQLILNDGGLGGSLMYNTATPTHLDVKDVTYRTLLTKAIPPQTRTIWKAVTVELEGQIVTLITLPGNPNPDYTRRRPLP
jgi:hypothetical protein